jgi:hypothetical protein
MLVSFDRAVFSLTESIIRDRCPSMSDGQPICYHTVASFLLDQHRRMPDYLRLPFTCLTLMFDVWPLPRTGRPFHRLSHEQRLQQIRAWRNSALGVRRDFIKFYETFAIFASYSEYYVNEEPH